MVTYGSCVRCQAPVFLNQTTDWYGNSVVTLNCWNGHYKWVQIEDLEEIKIAVDANVVTHISFFEV